MPLYSRPEPELTDEEIEAEARGELVPDDKLSAEDKNWKKRYGDLRSHTDKQLNALKAQLASLTEQLQNSTANKFDLPSTEDEVEAWMAKYPQVAAIVRTMAIKEARASEERIGERLKKITEKEEENEKEKAKIELGKIHSDFFDKIAVSDEFHAWLATKSKMLQNSIYENELDYQAAADTITQYKLETGYGRPAKRQRQDASGENAREVPRGRSSTPGTGLEPIFKESEIFAMSGAEFAKHEEAITKAQREGRIEYDMTNAGDEAR